MDELKSFLELLAIDPGKAIAYVKHSTKDTAEIKKYIKEYKKQDRSQRNSQVERIQIDKVKEGGNINRMVKICINHAQNIVQTLAAFTVGKPVTLKPSEDNNLSKIVKQIWRTNRIDSKILKSTITRMSETQVALQFYIKDARETSKLNKILVKLGIKTQKNEIKANILDNSKGTMTPLFDATGDMILFMWQYETKEKDKTIKHAELWDKERKYILSDGSGKYTLIDAVSHGFDRIPLVYDEQYKPEWYAVCTPIDRHEVAISKLGDENDYSGHPILVSEGSVNSLPNKEDSGKHINIPIKFDAEGNEIKGKVSFLESQTAPESNRLEIDKLEDIIAYGSSVPNLSFDKLKSLGNVAEKTVKLMFIATDIKAELHRVKSKVFIERCLNIIIGGVSTTTNKNLNTEAKSLYFDIQFNSILPSDISEKVDTISKAVDSGVMSKSTGVEILDMVDDIESELEKIQEEKEPIQDNTIE